MVELHRLGHHGLAAHLSFRMLRRRAIVLTGLSHCLDTGFCTPCVLFVCNMCGVKQLPRQQLRSAVGLAVFTIMPFLYIVPAGLPEVEVVPRLQEACPCVAETLS